MREDTSSHGQRYSNIELLRIISILAIICYHVVYHNNWSLVDGTGDWGSIFVPNDFTPGVFVLQSFLPFGISAVDIFVLITGYFLISSTKIKLEKCLKIYIQVLFYSLVLSFAFIIYYSEELSFDTIVVMLTPITHGRWWFLSNYLLLLILSPLINVVITKVDERRLIELLVFFTLIWFALPLITGYHYQGNELWWFIIVYIIGGLIRRHQDLFKKRCLFYFSCAFFTYLITIGMIVLFDFYDPAIFDFNHIQAIQYRNSLFSLLIAIFIFLGFKNMKIKENRLVNYIASLTLGVYIIHEHDLVVEHVFGLEWVGSCSTVLDILTTVIVLTLVEYCICLMIEAIRKMIFDKFILQKITSSIDIPIIKEKNDTLVR